MSSIKYNDASCETVANNLEDISGLLGDISSELGRLLNSIPNSDKIDRRISQKSTKTRANDDGTTETYIDYDTKRYYENNFKTPIINAKANISSTVSNLNSLKLSVDTIEERVRKIQQVVRDFESKELGEKYSSAPSGGGSPVDVDDNNGDSYVPAEEGDGKADLNIDTDNDGKPDINIDTNGDGKADLNIDTNNDGKPDTNIDTDGDGKADLNIDVDNDGAPDYNVDTDGDGKADLNVDTNNDGKPDYNIDLDGDGKADLNIDTNNDGKPDINIDVDGDGKADLNIDTNNDGKPDINIDRNGDGVIDPIIPSNKPGESTKFDDKDVGTTPSDNNDEDKNNPEESDLFKEQEANDSEDGFADNIVAGVTPVPSDNGNNGSFVSNTSNGTGGIWGVNAESNGVNGLFPFLPGSSTSSNGENPDFIYRGLYDQSGDSNFDMNRIKYNAIGESGSAVTKGAAIAGAVGLGVSSVDAATTLNENRKQDGDSSTTTEDKDEKKLIKTIISSGILGIMSIGYIIALLVSNMSLFAIILLGIAMAISSITTMSGLKIGKYIGFGTTLFVALLTFILSSCGVISPLGYIIVFAVFVILSIASFLLNLLKGMFDDKLDLMPIIIAVAVGLFFGMLKVLEIINWIIFVVLIGLTIGGYFLWDKVIKYKLSDDSSDDEIVNNVIYKPVQYVENSSTNVPEQQNFDPRNLYKEDDANNQSALSNMLNDQTQNPFANYNPGNSTFNNAFKDDNSNNSNGMF